MSILLSLLEKGVETLEYRRDGKNLLHVLKLSKIYQEGNGSEKRNYSWLVCWACPYLSWRPVQLMGQLAILTADSTDFGVNLFASLLKLFAFYRLTFSIGVGLSSLRSWFRTILLPVFQTVQMVASRKMQEAQPRIKELARAISGSGYGKQNQARPGNA